MSQIKLGFDKFPVPSKTQLKKLENFPGGGDLLDQSGNPLYTQVNEAIPELANASKSTSVYINNDSENVLQVKEQFPLISEVSSTLLGIPRTETQLSLFSDVSTYGLNPDEWEFYDFPGIYDRPREWETRPNSTFGDRHRVLLSEKTDEQALVISAFPVSYTYPAPPDDKIRYNETLYRLFKRFINLGNKYYRLFENNYPNFIKDNFLNPEIINADTPEGEPIFYNKEFTDRELYGLIENWTIAWMAIRDGNLIDPRSNEPLDFLPGFNTSNTRPGYSSNKKYFGNLRSKKAYRYQPGRISGFTFGARSSTDPSSSDNVIEWGIANNTDQYVFQIKGSNFSIVRRSTVKLPDQLVNSYGLTQTFEPDNNPLDLTEYHTLVIPSDNFNGDSLNGNGPSGHSLDPTKVTMYKIEFGWYGAIGAKFYVYIPVNNNEARWVLVHTLIIENQVGLPSLADPYFRFSYSISMNNGSFLTSPQYLYKYGASSFIDGGDAEIGKVYSYNSGERQINSTTSPESLIGIAPSATLQNSQGDNILNKKNIFLTDLKTISDQLTKLEITEVGGCPGFGHHYSPSLRANNNGKTVSLQLVSNNQFVLESGDDFDLSSDGSKLIADGLWNTYLNIDKNNPSTATISRIINDYQKLSNQNLSNETIVSGEPVLLENFDFSNIKLSSYSAIAASDYPFSGNKLDINFLNPLSRDSRHISDFFIGVTNKTPSVEFNNETGQSELKFQGDNDSSPVDITLDDILYEEYTSEGIFYDIDGVEKGEDQKFREKKMIVDYRLDQPEGEDSGLCSTISVNVEPTLSYSVTYSTQIPGNPRGNYLIFDNIPLFLLGNVDLFNSEYGISVNNVLQNSGVKIISESVRQYFNESLENNIFYVEISEPLTTTSFDIYFIPVSISGTGFKKSKIFNFDVKPLYVVVGLRDNASVNNITFLDTFESTSTSISPNWLLNNSNIEIVNSGGSAPNRNATNFISNDRLSSANIDTQLSQPLRPGKTLTTLYINDTESIPLTQIYGDDRASITTGLLNNKATFISATNLEDNNLNIVNLTVNTREG